MKTNSQQILIKNMVCNRCITAVEQIFDALKIPVKEIKLGEVNTTQNLNAVQLKKIESALKKIGFERIDSRADKIVEDVKKLVLNYLENQFSAEKPTLSAFITQHLAYDYSYLSDLFSTVEHKTIEQFFIFQRIEKVKALIHLKQYNLSEIAFQTGFSSVHHLSSQFKKVTQMTPTVFKKWENKIIKPIDRI